MAKKKYKRRRAKKTKLSLSKATRQSILAIVFIALGLLILVSLTGQGIILT